MAKSVQIANKPISYYQWPVGIITFFIILAIGNGFLLVTAFRGRPAAVDKSPYASSLVYDKVVKSLERAHALNLSAEFTVRGNQVLTNLTSQGEPLISEQIRMRLTRADTNSLDTDLVLLPTDSPGEFAGTLDSTRPGLWLAEVEVDTPGGVALLREQIMFE